MRMRSILFSLVIVAVATGCASGPPKRIQSAVGTMNRYMPEYVAEANKALADHPEGERLIGIGERLQAAMDSLDRWANGEGGE